MKNLNDLHEEIELMDQVQDLLLTREERLQLIANISLRQQERRDQLRRIWKLTYSHRNAKHILARAIINNIRRQEQRLRRLKELV